MKNTWESKRYNGPYFLSSEPHLWKLSLLDSFVVINNNADPTILIDVNERDKFNLFSSNHDLSVSSHTVFDDIKRYIEINDEELALLILSIDNIQIFNGIKNG